MRLLYSVRRFLRPWRPGEGVRLPDEFNTLLGIANAEARRLNQKTGLLHLFIAALERIAMVDKGRSRQLGVTPTQIRDWASENLPTDRSRPRAVASASDMIHTELGDGRIDSLSWQPPIQLSEELLEFAHSQAAQQSQSSTVDLQRITLNLLLTEAVRNPVRELGWLPADITIKLRQPLSRNFG